MVKECVENRLGVSKTRSKGLRTELDVLERADTGRDKGWECE